MDINPSTPDHYNTVEPVLSGLYETVTLYLAVSCQRSEIFFPSVTVIFSSIVYKHSCDVTLFVFADTN